MPYGDPLPEARAEDDGADRGLVFVCFNASISRQFEGVQIQWLNDGNIFKLGHDKDYLMGDSVATAKMTIQGDPPFFLGPLSRIVTMRGKSGKPELAQFLRDRQQVAPGEALGRRLA